MHSVLHLSNLSTLPLVLRRKQTLRSMDLCAPWWNKISTLSNAQMLLLLPVFYARLDATKLPTILERLDSSVEVEHIRQLIRRILISLRGAVLSLVPDGACLDIWPRIWPSIEFLDTHRDHLPEPERAKIRHVHDAVPLHGGLRADRRRGARDAKEGYKDRTNTDSN
ncbi:hypothetical protein C8F04DRAFT_1303673 [Mycena alexandri]|uniref:Uncharacterized protein n=1 Tax=Mycena alexandri TaxID=1745969 RepID=A0AAD6SAZ5_9AGAR|nr:hypothetical protein C8F04DRAFT_1303673 [Mycena alexandri]